MKIFMKILMVLFLVGIVSCRDTKEEEATNEAIEKIEAVVNEADEISKKIEKEASEVEQSLKELDSI
jgi:ArsR family metal-binding transcriptional regulator